MQMTGRSCPGGAEVLEQRRAEGAGRSVCGFVLLRHDRYLGGWCLGFLVTCRLGFSSGVAGPGGGSAAQVMPWVVLPFLLVVLVLTRVAVERGAGSPAGQQAQGVLGGRPRLGGVGEEALTGIGSQRERLECQLKVPDDRVVDELHASGVDPDVVGGPPCPELVAAGGQLPD